MAVPSFLILSSILGTGYQFSSNTPSTRGESRSTRRFHMGDGYGVRPIPIPKHSPSQIRQLRHISTKPISVITQNHKNGSSSKKESRHETDHRNKNVQENKGDFRSSHKLGTVKDNKDSLDSNHQVGPVQDNKDGLDYDHQAGPVQDNKDNLESNHQIGPAHDRKNNLKSNHQIEPVQESKPVAASFTEDKAEPDYSFTSEAASSPETKIDNESMIDPMKIHDPADVSYVKVNLTSPTPLFISFEKSILLDSNVFWTGDKKATKIDTSIYNFPEPDSPPCLYPNENEPGTCLNKSHEGFYLTGDAYVTEPFECYSNFKVTVRKTIKFDEWEPSFNRPLSISQLVALIRPPLRPAPRTNHITFKVTCPVAGKKVINFKPLYYKMRGLSYNEAYLVDPGTSRGYYQDIHFPVLTLLGIVHGIYSVIDYQPAAII